MSKDGGDIAIETLNSTNPHHSAIFPSVQSESASEIQEPQNDSEDVNLSNEPQCALELDENSYIDTKSQSDLQSKQGEIGWDPFPNGITVLASASSTGFEKIRDGIMSQTTLPQNMDGAENDDDFADFDSFVDHKSEIPISENNSEAFTERAAKENERVASGQELDSHDNELLSSQAKPDPFGSGELQVTGDGFADFSGFEEAASNPQIESVQSNDVEAPPFDDNDPGSNNVSCSNTQSIENPTTSKDESESNNFFPENYEIPSDRARNDFTTFEQGTPVANNVNDNFNKQGIDWADFGASSFDQNDIQTNDTTFFTGRTENVSDASKNSIQIESQNTLFENKIFCHAQEINQDLSQNVENDDKSIPLDHLKNNNIPPSGDQAIEPHTSNTPESKENLSDNKLSDNLKQQESNAIDSEELGHCDNVEDSAYSKFDLQLEETTTESKDNSLRATELEVDGNDNEGNEQVTSNLQESDNWAFFGNSEVAQNDSEFDDGTDFADFANFDNFAQSTQQPQQDNVVSDSNPEMNNFAPFSQNEDQVNEDDFDDFEAFSEQQSVDVADTVGNFNEGTGTTFTNHSNGFLEGANDFRHSAEQVSWDRASPMPGSNRGFRSISEMLIDVDYKTENDFVNEQVVTEDPLLIQDFFVSMSIASDVSKELNEEVESMWSVLADLSNSASLVLDVPNCILNSQLLSSLGVDVNNTLSTVKQNLPKYAAQLGLLQPMKSGEVKNEQDSLSASVGSTGIKSASSSQRNQTMLAGNSPTPDAVPDVEFDWGTSGLKNPLEMQSLSLDFFDSQFNSSSAATAASKLEEEFLSELGEEADSHSGFGGGGGGGGGATTTNGSIGGTSRGATDSKLASILTVAQSSSLENVSVAVGGLNPSALQNNNNNDPNCATQLVFNPHSTNLSVKQSYKTTTSIQNGIGYFNGLQMMEKSSSTNCQLDSQRNYHPSSNNQSYNHFSNCLPNKFGASNASTRTNNNNSSSMSTNNNKWSSWIFRRK